VTEAVVLALYAPLIAVGAVLVWRRPVRAIYAFVVGLAVHNIAMAELWELGVRGGWLDVVAAWKEVLLASALCSIVVRERGIPFRATGVDYLALAYGAFVLVYLILPQGWLDGDATAKGELLATRHHLVPVAAYFLGRGLELGEAELRRIVGVIVGTAAALAVVGLVDIYAVPLDWWRDSGAPGWYREQLGHRYMGLSGLPENFVYNPGGEEPLRRLVSTFMSPLATSYVLVAGLLFAAWRLRGRWLVASVALLGAALLYTHSRSSLVALAGALVILTIALRRLWPLVAAAAVVVAAAAFFAAYSDIAPETSFTPQELRFQRAQAERAPDASHDPFSADESSISSHWRNLRDGVETVARHPQGYGLGNSGATASRTGVKLKAGESTYTELGVDVGLVGALLFVAWSLALLVRLIARAPWLAAAFAAVLAIGIQTDVIGVHWVAYVLWALAGTRS
jgi:hypothetical protein